jgi:hypothetical protein
MLKVSEGDMSLQLQLFLQFVPVIGSRELEGKAAKEDLALGVTLLSICPTFATLFQYSNSIYSCPIVMNVSGVGTRQTVRQHFLASRNHESAGIIFMDKYKYISNEKI